MLVRVQFGPTVRQNLTDRAKRYRAQKNVTGPRRCVLCGSTEDLGVMHLDGDESHGEARNLAWGCRSCNQILSHEQPFKAWLSKRSETGNAMTRNDQFARSLGPDAYDPPVMPCEPHPFMATLEGSLFCGRCGAGLLHEIHAATVLLDEAA